MAPDATQDSPQTPRPDKCCPTPWRPHTSRAPLDTTASASVIQARTLRHELRRWLDDDVTEHAARDITLTAYEAIVEILTRRADPLNPGPLRLQAHLDDQQVHITISYTGHCTDPADPEQAQYRLTLIHALSDQVSFHREPHTFTVQLTTYRQPPTQGDGDKRR
jgi:anti-sigma regulatory factor (Ser/Thr protein kinase)